MNETWLVYASIATMLLALGDFTIGVVSRTVKPEISSQTLNIAAYVFMAITGICIALYSAHPSTSNDFVSKTNKGFKEIYEGDGGTWMAVPIAAVFYIIGNRYLWNSYKTSPDMGIAETVGSVSSVVLLILTAAMFNAKWEWMNVLGIVVSAIGLALVSGTSIDVLQRRTR